MTRHSHFEDSDDKREEKWEAYIDDTWQPCEVVSRDPANGMVIVDLCEGMLVRNTIDEDDLRPNKAYYDNRRYSGGIHLKREDF